MARRRRTQFLDDDDPDSSSSDRSPSDIDPDPSDPAGSRKRKRYRTKEDHIYGVFADSDEDNEARGGVGRTVQGTNKRGHKIDYRSGQAFVPSTGMAATTRDATNDDSQRSGSQNSSDGSDSDEEDDEVRQDDVDDDDDSASESERIARRPAPAEEHLAARPSFAGLGSTGVPTQMDTLVKEERQSGQFRPASFVSSRAGIGSRPAQGDDASPSATPRPGLGSRAGIGGSSASAGPSSMPSRAGIGARPSFVSGSSAAVAEEATPHLAGFSNGSQQQPQQAQAADDDSANRNAAYPVFSRSSMADAGLPSDFASVAPAVAPSKAFQRKEKPSFVSASSSTGAASLNGPGTSIKFGTGAGGKFDPSAYLAKMGWTGGGLGKQGEGIINPIEVQLRPERAGIAFGGRKEKTKQAKEEARRRGEAVSSDEEERSARRQRERGEQRDRNRRERGDRAAERQPQQQAWTKAEKKPRKPRVEHRTYEQIIEEAGGIPATDPAVGQVFDASGREVASLSAALANKGVPTADTTKLPELRHNLRLICENNLQTLTVLAKEGANILERRKWLTREADESKRRRDREQAEATRLSSILVIVKELEALGARHVVEGEDLDVFSPCVHRLVKTFSEEIERERLDEAVVGAIAPMLRRLWADWEPLKQPDYTTTHLVGWKAALRIREPAQPEKALVDRYGVAAAVPPKSASKNGPANVMTAYESLLWNLWMPKIRGALNNEWRPDRAAPAVQLVESWKPVLPRFILDNIVEQLLLPKLEAAVRDWEPRRSKVGLHHILFPWLPLLGDRLDGVLSDAKRRVRSQLQTWRPRDGVPPHLARWRDVYDKHDFESMLLSHVVPKLSASVREDFTVDPSSQDMTVLERLVEWTALLRPSVVARVVEVEFFPKWLGTLHLWLTQPGANLEEVATWYEFWKGWWPRQLVEERGVANGFQRGLQMLNDAVSLPPAQRMSLPRPQTTHLPRSSSSPATGHSLRNASTTTAATTTATRSSSKPTAANGDDETITLRQILEERAAESDLILLALNRLEPNSGESLLRLSANVNGKRGVTLYISDDVVYISDTAAGGGTGSAATKFRPVGIEELIEIAKRGGGAS